MRLKKRLLILIILLSLPVILNAGSIKTSVKVLEIIPGTLSTQLNFTGYLAPTQRVTLRSEADGTVEKIAVQEGQVVKKGEILVHISTETLSLNVQKAKSDYDLAVANFNAQQTALNNKIDKRKLMISEKSAKANMEQALEDFKTEQQITTLNLTQKQLLLKQQQAESNDKLAQSELEKEAQLLSKNMSSQSKLDSYQNKADVQRINLALVKLDIANNNIKSDLWRQKNAKTKLDLQKLAYEKAQLEVEDYNTKTDNFRLESYRNRMVVAKIQLQQAKLNYKKSQIKAPFTGIIREKNVEFGGYVREGENILELIEISDVVVKMNVPETQIRNLKIHQEARIRLDAYPKKAFRGIINTIGLEANLKTRSFPVEVKLQNKNQKLLPGMMSRVWIEQPKKSDQIIIPNYAVIEKEFNQVVFIEKNGKAVERTIKTGEKVKDQVQVLSGIKKGDKLVISGHQFLSDNDDVLIIQTSKQLVSK